MRYLEEPHPYSSKYLRCTHLIRWTAKCDVIGTIRYQVPPEKLVNSTLGLSWEREKKDMSHNSRLKYDCFTEKTTILFALHSLLAKHYGKHSYFNVSFLLPYMDGETNQVRGQSLTQLKPRVSILQIKLINLEPQTDQLQNFGSKIHLSHFKTYSLLRYLYYTFC